MPVKRPPTSKAAVRARQGDLGAKLELWVERLSALASGKEKLSFTHVLTLALVGALLIVTGGGVYTYMASRSVRLSVDDAAALKDVFLSGQPWLVECTAGSPSDVMYKAETRHAAPIKTALLDCGKKLPSGKTTIERFKLKTPGKGPFIIAVSNLELPVTAGWLPAILSLPAPPLVFLSHPSFPSHPSLPTSHPRSLLYSPATCLCVCGPKASAVSLPRSSHYLIHTVHLLCTGMMLSLHQARSSSGPLL